VKSKPQPDPPRTVPHVDGVEVTANRCPFCHEGVQADGANVACEGCLARHHAPCWDEGGGRCAACGGERALVAAGAGHLPPHVLHSVFFGFSVLLMPLVLWLKLAHGIERIGPVSVLVVPFAPMLIGAWLNFAINAKRNSPRKRLALAALLAVATLCLAAALVISSLP